MDRPLCSLSLLSSFLLLVAVGHGAVPPQVLYWRSVFPNTPMPGAIRDHIASDALGDTKSTSVSVGSGGVHVGTGKPGKGGTTVNVGSGGVHVGTGKPGGGGTTVNVGHGGVNVGTGKPGGSGTSVNVGHGGVHVGTGKPGGGGTTVNVGHGGVNVGTGKPGGGGTSVNVGHGGVHVGTGKPGGGTHTNVNVGGHGFVYQYAAEETQIHDDPNVALFFLEKDLRPGTTMNLHFTKTTPGAAFLTRKEADAIPFSSAELPQVLDHFSVKDGSEEAEAMRQTIGDCESPAVRGERKLCATSLESMVEFATNSLGTSDLVASSTVVVGKAVTPRQAYTVTDVKEMAGDRLAACHAETYPYAVFYCHATATTKGYTVGMKGADGTAAEAVAVCHTDTRAWNPNHVSFKVLKVKPGTVPVCHFLPEDHLVWSRRG